MPPSAVPLLIVVVIAAKPLLLVTRSVITGNGDVAVLPRPGARVAAVLILLVVLALRDVGAAAVTQDRRPTLLSRAMMASRRPGVRQLLMIPKTRRGSAGTRQ